MKIVINRCFGGFSLSALAIKRLAELKGKECYFFSGGLGEEYKPISLEDANKTLFFCAFTVPNPDDYKLKKQDKNDTYKTANERLEQISLEQRPEDRTDKYLIQVVEELGEKADGRCAELQVIEIPDDIEWEIDEYYGIETVEEKHRSWC